ncbi:MAG: hypothetical protein ABIQ88_22790 [Chitinophagaceae bacterium]
MSNLPGSPIAYPASIETDYANAGNGMDANQLPQLPQLPQIPFPPLHFCLIDLKQGCYKIDYKPKTGPFVLGPSYRGTLRVENSGLAKIISGDLYKFPIVLLPTPFNTDTEFDDTADGELIPVYPRGKYYSYLKATRFIKPPISASVCKITIEAEEWVYNPPAAGSFNGSFNAAATRTIKFIIGKGADANTFTGDVFSGATNIGTITLTWVSTFFRRAVVEIDTLKGAVAPMPLNPGTPSEESFATVFKTVGWKMDPVYNDTNVAVPGGVSPTACWSDANLHALMLSVRSAAVTLDNEWHYHMMVVPGSMGCSRGKMYDQLGAHREACVSYSNDGYPTSDSSNFGAAANQQQRNVPRAFIRSAAHELGHTCNMQHQELEGGADNSIMTTTPSVANVLGSATTGAPGVFPTNIHLGFNAHCRHHLIHFPDPVVRPGAMNWTAGHPALGGAFAPSADGGRIFISADAVRFTIKTQSEQVKIGEPLLIAWEVENNSQEDIPMPNDIGVNIDYTMISVTDRDGNVTNMNNFVLECEHSSIQSLAPGKKLAAATNLFWSSNGFAFNKPGQHTIDISVRWTSNGIPYGLHASKKVWVDYPSGDKENEIAMNMMNEEVGMFVALGGNAYHLKGAVSRIQNVMKIDPKNAVAKAVGKMYSATAAKAYTPFKLVREKRK